MFRGGHGGPPYRSARHLAKSATTMAGAVVVGVEGVAKLTYRLCRSSVSA